MRVRVLSFKSPTINTAIVLLVAVASMLFVLCSGCKEGPAGPQGSQGQQGPPGGSNIDLANPNIQPQVLYSTPANNAVGPFEFLHTPGGSSLPHFVVVFNKYITKASVTSSNVRCIGFDKPVSVRLFQLWYSIRNKSEALNSEYYDNILEFTIIDSLSSYYVPLYRVGRRITILIDSTLVDINGNHLVQQHQFLFTPEPYFRVAQMYPKSGTQNAYTNSTIQLSFNSTLAASSISALHIVPQFEGQWMFSPNLQDSSALVFSSVRPFAFGSSWNVSVDNNAQDVYGNRINAPFSGTFSVGPFKVSSTSPQDGATGVSISSSYIALYFTGEIDTTSARQAFTISPVVAFRVSPYTNSVFLSPTDGFAPSIQYTVTASTLLRAFDGTPLPGQFSFTFSTDQFRLSFNPSYGAYNVPLSREIIVYSNAPLDTATVRSAISISPAVQWQVTPYSPGSSPSMRITPRTSWAPNTRYTVVLGTTLRTKTGYSLTSPQSTTFTTRP